MAGRASGICITLIGVAAALEGALILANWFWAVNPTATAIHEFFRLGLGVAITHVAAAVLLFTAYRWRKSDNAVFAILAAMAGIALISIGVLWLTGADLAAQPLRLAPIQTGPDGSFFRFAGALAAIAVGLAGFASLMRASWRWPLLAAGAVLTAEALYFMSAAIRPSNILLLLLGIGFLLAGAGERQEVPEF